MTSPTPPHTASGMGCVFLCPPTGSLQSLRTPSGLSLHSSRRHRPGILRYCPVTLLISGDWGGGWQALLLCLQLVQKVGGVSANIQGGSWSLEPGLDSPLEKRGLVPLTPKPSSSGISPESTGKARALCSTSLLQD